MPTESQVKCGTAIPQIFLDGPVDMVLVGNWIKRAEALGYHSLWTQEDVTGDYNALEPVSLLCYASALTTKVRLGVSVMLAPLHNPMQLAKSLSTLDQMSGGRLIAGVGLGDRTNYYPAFGLSSDRRVHRFVEVLEVMKALWTEEKANYQGYFWQLDNIDMEPKPAQKPHPPIWFGGRHPSALRRAVRHGDGWMGAGSITTEQFREGVGRIKTFLEEAGRDPSNFSISKRVYVAIDNDEQRAERRLREWFGGRYKNAELASQVSIWGSAAHCTEKLAEVLAAGAQLVALNPVFDHMEHLEVLAQEVVTKL